MGGKNIPLIPVLFFKLAIIVKISPQMCTTEQHGKGLNLCYCFSLLFDLREITQLLQVLVSSSLAWVIGLDYLSRSFELCHLTTFVSKCEYFISIELPNRVSYGLSIPHLLQSLPLTLQINSIMTRIVFPNSVWFIGILTKQTEDLQSV